MMVVAEKDDAPQAVAVTPEWRHRVTKELDRRGRGAAAELARAIDISTGALSELLADDPPGTPPKARWSRYVEPINTFLKLPSMLPLAPDMLELVEILKGLDADDRDLLRGLRDLPVEERRALVALIRARLKPHDRE